MPLVFGHRRNVEREPVLSRNVFDSVNQKVIDEFRRNGGEVALADFLHAQGVPDAHERYDRTTLLILHHTGAKSGIVREDPLSYQRVEGGYALFGTAGGSPSKPGWYYNLLANPKARIEVGTETLDVTARVAEGEERERIWERQKADMPRFARYEEITPREIPVVILEVDE
jgi:deazaflavin-dependent oxidoreductase (nitroreductase family)